jgi:hypothetical protein
MPADPGRSNDVVPVFSSEPPAGQPPMWPTPVPSPSSRCCGKSQFPRDPAAAHRRPSPIPLRTLFSFVGNELEPTVNAVGSARFVVTSDTRNCSYCEKFRITKVTFTPRGAAFTIQVVVWQFWGRAAGASLTEKSRALFYCLLETWQSPPQRRHPERGRFSRPAKTCPERSRSEVCAHRRSRNSRAQPREMEGRSPGCECYNSACPIPN